MQLYNYQTFKRINSEDYKYLKNYAISLYSEYLIENNLFESVTDVPEISKNEINNAEKSARKGDYSKVAKIYQAFLSKTRKAGIAFLLVSNLLSGCNINTAKFTHALEKEGVNKEAIEQVTQNIKDNKVEEITQNNLFSNLGYDLTARIKKEDESKGEYQKTPCYAYTFEYMKLLNPNLSKSIFQEMKMPYGKDINTLNNQESMKLAKNSLGEKSELNTLASINSKHGIGTTITNVNDIQVGDIINFWIYDFIEFSPKEENYSDPNTKAEFETYKETHTVNENDWFIEGVKIVYGHYAVVSAVDGEYVYLSSSGEKGGVNGIWNNVKKSDTSEFLTKIKKSDFKFNQMKYEDIKFKRTDDISNSKVRLPLRIDVVRMNQPS